MNFWSSSSLVALQSLLVGAHLRFGGRQLRLDLRSIQRHQLCSARHRLAFLKVQIEETPVDLRPDNHRFLGQQAAHSRNFVRHGPHRHGGGLDGQPLGGPAAAGAAPPGFGGAAEAAPAAG